MKNRNSVGGVSTEVLCNKLHKGFQVYRIHSAAALVAFIPLGWYTDRSGAEIPMFISHRLEVLVDIMCDSRRRSRPPTAVFG